MVDLLTDLLLSREVIPQFKFTGLEIQIKLYHAIISNM